MNHNQPTFRYLAGYTLVEISIVLVIIGLLAAGVIAGSQLIAGAKIKRIIDEVQIYQQAVISFNQKYYELPGDMSDATEQFDASVEDGDGDGSIVWGGSPNEGAQAFLHMAKAGFIADSGLSGTGDDAILGSNIPASGVTGAGYYLNTNATLGNFLGIGGQQPAGENNRQILPADSAYSLDNKLDDGIPDSGRLQAVNSGNCYTAATYNVASDGSLCSLMLKLATE